MLTQDEIKELAAHCDVWKDRNFAKDVDCEGNPCLWYYLCDLRGIQLPPTFTFEGHLFDKLTGLLGGAWVVYPTMIVKQRLQKLLAAN